MELLILTDVFICVWQHEAERKGRNELPVSPALHGRYDPNTVGSYVLSKMDLDLRTRPISVPKVDRSEGHAKVIFSDKDVRPESTTKLPPIWLVPNHRTAEVIPIEWHATAHDASKRLGGTLNVAVSQLLQQRPTDGKLRQQRLGTSPSVSLPAPTQRLHGSFLLMDELWTVGCLQMRMNGKLYGNNPGKRRFVMRRCRSLGYMEASCLRPSCASVLE